MRHDPRIHRARRLRTEDFTEPEEIFWNRVRNRRYGGFKFRRQHPYGRYILDFFCAEFDLAVELDGKQHLVPEEKRRDAERTAFLESRGVTVIRVDNEDVVWRLPAVMDRIGEEIRRLRERRWWREVVR